MKKFKWTEEQKKALRGSIRKWTNIVNGTGVDEGVDNCPCCRKWYDNDDCAGCPIREFTGQDGCSGSPYDLYRYSAENPKFPFQYEASVAELNFLRAVYLAGGGK